MTRLSHSQEVMKKVLNGQALTEVEKGKIGLRLRRYKMEIRSSYSGEMLEEYLNEVDKFFHLLNTDTTRLTWEWFLIETRFKHLRIGVFSLIIEALTGYISHVEMTD